MNKINTIPEKFTHLCQKCRAAYEDEDPDPYLCEVCTAKRAEIARIVDEKLKNRQSKRVVTMTPLQEYEAAEKVHGFPRVRF